MDVFAFRDQLIAEYEQFTRSFVSIRATDIKKYVNQEYDAGRFWPAPMVQLNPAFVSGGDIGEFVAEGLLHPECERIFRCRQINRRGARYSFNPSSSSRRGGTYRAATGELRPHHRYWVG